MPSAPDAAEVPAPAMSQASRFVNVFIDPKPAFADIAARPSWWLPMVLLVVCSLAYILLFSSHVGWEHMTRQQFEQSKAAQNMSPEDREKNIQIQLKYGPPLGIAIALFAAPIVLLLTAAVFLFVFNFMLGAAVKFSGAFAVVAWASLPNLVMTAGFTLVMFLKDPTDFDLKNPAGFNLGFYLDPKGVPAWLYALAGSIDVFSLWLILLMATGMAALTRKKWSTALTGVLIPWGVYVLLRMAGAAIFG